KSSTPKICPHDRHSMRSISSPAANCLFPTGRRPTCWMSVRQGKGFRGSHSATDCLYSWADYGDLLGGYFDGQFRQFSRDRVRPLLTLSTPPLSPCTRWRSCCSRAQRSAAASMTGRPIVSPMGDVDPLGDHQKFPSVT